MNGVMQTGICSEQFWNRNGTTAQFTLCRIAGRHPYAFEEKTDYLTILYELFIAGDLILVCQ